MHAYPEHRHLLYSPAHERAACGMGFVADIEGRPTHALLQMALEAVVNLTHRGAVSADGKTGDGAGVLTQIPRAFFRRELAAQNVTLGEEESFAVGMLFLPGRDASAREACVRIVEETIRAEGLRLLAWRQVPIDRSALGEKAFETCPAIHQVFVAPGANCRDATAFERALYLTRRRIERTAFAAGIEEFYIPSFSHRTLVYKGLMVAPQLSRFYPDLADPLYETALAVFHQRYSTNTFPTWFLAQPFRYLAHNGEINTLQGNQNWMRAREPELRSTVWGDRIRDLLPIIQPGGSDSANLDNVFEAVTLSGRHPLHAMMMLVPAAYQNVPNVDPEIRAFYEYHATLVEPWDGPASIAFSDGTVAAATLDRNGLRPARYAVTEDGLVVLASEAGLVRLDPARIVEKGRLGPGQMIAVDTAARRLMHDAEIKGEFARRRPYRKWVSQRMIRPHLLDLNKNGRSVPEVGEPLARQQVLFGYGTEDLDRILAPMAFDGKEPVGSMGDDTPLAVLSEKPRLLYTYFKQRFAQVTNPPIDPLRERLVMSLNTALGRRGSILEECPECARLIKFTSPILTRQEFEWLIESPAPRFRSETLPALFEAAQGPAGLERALERLCESAVAAASDGVTLLVLSDNGAGPNWAPIPMLLAVAAVHHRLIRAGCRMGTSLVVETGEAREDHHFACLIGYGAAVVYPYLAYKSVAELAESSKENEKGISARRALENYKKAVEHGLLKIMSKMGISTVSSYRGAQIFEAIGLSADVIDRYFTGTDSRVGGVGLEEIAADVLRFHAEAFGGEPELAERGIYRFRKGGEYHAFNPTVFKALHHAVRTGEYETAYRNYARLVAERPPVALRDLLDIRPGTPIPIEEVEPAAEIVKRFCTPGMSHGALSREAHETLAIAMNRIGAKSNSGEGGEARERFYPYENGDWGNSAIKQVASGRFGVTPEYLISASELEIKMAQGSKPGEGGQIPGTKVSEEIATIRHSVPGVTLISPPPHHDIYSIEDLAQLIYDLKRVNPRAKVAVKLVAEAGVGTVAAGVAKGYADVIHISGHDGGTGASPLGSIKNAGIPWELGLAETQQVLVINDLRGRVRLRTDGGLKTGRDVMIAALLGAEEYGFGTAALVSAGCVMARQCHMNNCPVGVATQRADLRAKFPGTPEHVVSFMLFVAEEVREWLAQLGFRKLEEVIGRSDLLKPRAGVLFPKTDRLLLDAILADPDPSGRKPRRCLKERNDRPDAPLDDAVARVALEALEAGRVPFEHTWEINNTERTVGARLSGEIARRFRDEGLPTDTFRLTFRGSAGQSFGAFCNKGMTLILEGEAQDYVGKSMSGGKIVIRPPAEARFATHENTIMGNTVMYGATGGGLYAAGRAGERFCVRNSGGHAVVEGVGDHGCEYMTGGVVVVLGECGRNFAAGMSGGLAFVLDEKRDFEHRYNPQMVGVEPVVDALDLQLLRSMIERHRELTDSRRAAEILERWEAFQPLFYKVVPHPSEATAKPQDAAAVEADTMRQLAEEAQEPIQLEIGRR